jgi:ribosomal protein S6--L-glutamate ligase
VDVVVARYASNLRGKDIAGQLSGRPFLNQPWAIEVASDHWATLQALRGNGVPQAESLLVLPGDSLDEAFAALGRPLVVKRPDTSGGRGVYLIASEEQYDHVRTLGPPGPYVAQRLYPESLGADLRVLILGGRVVASVRRLAAPGEWRANVERGGTLSPCRLEPDEVDTALAAARSVGLDLVGIDMLRTDRGTIVIEANAKPGVRTARACGFPIGAELVVCAEAVARGETPWRAPRSDACAGP